MILSWPVLTHSLWWDPGESLAHTCKEDAKVVKHIPYPQRHIITRTFFYNTLLPQFAMVQHSHGWSNAIHYHPLPLTLLRFLHCSLLPPIQHTTSSQYYKACDYTSNNTLCYEDWIMRIICTTRGYNSIPCHIIIPNKCCQMFFEIRKSVTSSMTLFSTDGHAIAIAPYGVMHVSSCLCCRGVSPPPNMTQIRTSFFVKRAISPTSLELQSLTFMGGLWVSSSHFATWPFCHFASAPNCHIAKWKMSIFHYFANYDPNGLFSIVMVCR